MIPSAVLAQLARLEDQFGFDRAALGVGQRDQFAAALRDQCRGLGVDLGDELQATAAFAGAMLLLALMGPPVPCHPYLAVGMVRALADRAQPASGQ